MQLLARASLISLCLLGSALALGGPVPVSAASPLTITTASSPTSPPNATVGKAYSFTLRATGGSGSYSWTKTSGTLPPGLSLSADGVISGTPTSTSRNNGFTVQVSSGSASASRNFSVWANPAPISPFGKAFCTAYGASSAIEGPDNVWACGPASAGFTPATPYDSDGFQCVEYSARFLSAVYGLPAANDGLGNFNYGYEFVNSVATNPQYFKIDGKAIPEATTTAANDVVPSPGDIVSFGGPGAWGFAEPTAGHTAVVTTPPPGSDTPAGDFWILSQDFGSKQEGFGTTVGEQELSINTTLGHVLMLGLPSAPTPFSWLVLPGPPPPPAQPVTAAKDLLTITTPSTPASPPNATVGQSYGFDLEASGPGSYPGLYEKAGHQLYYWSLAAGSLPPGLSLSSNGTIAGTPRSVSKGGSFTVKVTAVGQVAEQTFTIWALDSNSSLGSDKGLATLFRQAIGQVPSGALPKGTAIYNDATCPSASQCYAVGSASGQGIVTETSDAGQHWSTKTISGSGGLSGIACSSASDCDVGGAHQAGAQIFVTTNGGQSWKAQSPPNSSGIGSMACPSSSDCLAVAVAKGAATDSLVIATTDGGAHWTKVASPGTGLTTVRCVDKSDCWLTGPGVYFTGNLGRSWRPVPPPQPPAPSYGIGSVYYSLLIDVEFQSARDGWAVGGDQCGGQGVTYCSGAVFSTTDGGVSWTFSQASLDLPFGWQIACQGEGCLLVTQKFHSSQLYSSSDQGSHWSELFDHQGQINALACTPARSLCVLAGGTGKAAILDTLG
ncbi:MAG TPA: putative Ig domain-containing protein [Candidatus Dormibacteraeota bacterium]